MKRTERINIDVRRGGYTSEELDRMKHALYKIIRKRGPTALFIFWQLIIRQKTNTR